MEATDEQPLNVIKRIFAYVDIPPELAVWLVDDARVIANIRDIPLLRHEDIAALRTEYMAQYDENSDALARWPWVITNRIKFLIDWFKSYRLTFGNFPNPRGLAKTHFDTLPEEFARSQDPNHENLRLSLGENNRFSNVTTRSRFSMGTNVTSSSQSPRRNVKVSITDFPKFNGDAKEWIPFSRKFLAVASSQGFEYLFQDPEFIPITASDEAQYKSDLGFIFDAFKNSWAGSRNHFLVQQAEKPEKNGRKIYFDA
jgi:hypothetical protein